MSHFQAAQQLGVSPLPSKGCYLFKYLEGPANFAAFESSLRPVTYVCFPGLLGFIHFYF